MICEDGDLLDFTDLDFDGLTCFVVGDDLMRHDSGSLHVGSEIDDLGNNSDDSVLCLLVRIKVLAAI